MFIFSTDQIQSFLDISPEWIAADKTLLDLGAGDGGVTAKLSKFYGNVYTTEMSQVMQWRLRQQNFLEEDPEKWSSSSRQYNLISALNLLDRHYNPRKLLLELHDYCVTLKLLRSNGCCSTFMWLKTEGRTFEEHASSLVENEFIPAGFELVKWTKLPYLCEGDFNKPYYLLSDALFLLRPVPTERISVESGTSHAVHNEL
ncbi:DREV methyltransferase [Oesophagostomum dentatum]|uniref:DREV methyltransferase n=1 Tax=Oesophagostomum dentatum TaxID=61180 RepID=A0A0B1TB87_OESDE|nr:DREV methyltransferase [Oesophagostomum dentatum]